jgi:ribonucleotide reductase alpha subunit
VSDYLCFRMKDEFIEGYQHSPDWGMPMGAGNMVGEYMWINQYARRKPDGTKEQFWEGLRRVIEGMYSIQKEHALRYRLPWDEETAHLSAQEAYARAFAGKWSPPGRGLWMMGTELVNGRMDSSPLQNCAFISTASIASMKDPSTPFTRMMDMSMLGVGVGFDVLGAGKLTLHEPEGTIPHEVADSREGWCEATGHLLRSYFLPGRKIPVFDYTKVRPAGSPIRGFGGIASGPNPLIKLHHRLVSLLRGRQDQPITSSDVADIMNMVGKCVVSANVRRSAQIALGPADDGDFLDLKNWEKNPVRMGADGWGHLSNNSIYAVTGGDYSHIAKRIALNGEPGIFWLDVAQNYGRLCDPADGKEYRTRGVNPCLRSESTLLSPSGITTLGNTEVGDTIWSEDGWVHVIRKVPTGVKPVFRYRTAAGFVEVTENHRVVSNGVKVEAREALSIDWLCDGLTDRHVTWDEPHKSFSVTGVEPLGEHQVWDITVSGPSHTYWTGGMNVSNCGEQPLEDNELCTLVEVYPSRCDDMQDFLRTLKFAYLYGKTVTLLMTRWPETNEVMIRNRRIGTSITGVAQFAEKHGWAELRRWQDAGYNEIRRWDRIYSEWLGIRESIRVTTVKPSGTVSLLWGVTAGIHWPRERGFYVATYREQKDSPMVRALEAAGYPVEPSVMDPDEIAVVTVPVEGPDIRPEREVSIWEKTSLAAQCQRFWSDNAVSVTVTFREDEATEIPAVLRAFDGQLKSISMLPMAEGTYAQAPYQRVSRETWDELRANIRPLDWASLYAGAAPDPKGELYCSTDTCELPG